MSECDVSLCPSTAQKCTVKACPTLAPTSPSPTTAAPTGEAPIEFTQKTAAPVTDDYIKPHNVKRTLAGLAAVQYDKSIEAFAQGWAKQLASSCTMKHSTQAQRENIKHPLGTGVGENLYEMSTTGSSGPTWTDAVNAWWDEIKDYTYGPSSAACEVKNAGKVVGHFTQVAWECSLYVGCARATCQSGGFTKTIMVCNYGKQGNFVGQLPFSGTVAKTLGLNGTPCDTGGKEQGTCVAAKTPTPIGVAKTSTPVPPPKTPAPKAAAKTPAPKAEAKTPAPVTPAGPKTPSPVGCDNKPGSTAVLDVCGVCGGNGASCKGYVQYLELHAPYSCN